MQQKCCFNNAIGRGLELPTNIQHYRSDETRKLQPNCKSKTLKIIYVSLTNKKHCKKLPPFQKTFSRNSDLLKSPHSHWAKPLCVSNAIFSLLIHSPAARKERYTTQTQPQICHHVEDTILSIFLWSACMYLVFK